ncbi:MAG TPA: YceI family protein [Aggregatilinea sp.]|uniref:YceI family protein n=1 Tax=Aggregatilinea sp. TaxID=2806333 RepID=UPI002B9C4942|nr:YceI family protein [Aggregatilinea sp.]HML21021.1 YceI family protein [Aggregatilinea sp.]
MGRRGAAVLLLMLVVVLIGITFVTSWWLDPGDKDDRTTDLVTPTLTAQTARVFAVDAEASRVDFVAEVRGVQLKGVFPVEAGTITLEPVDQDLRVLVQLNIDVDHVDTGNAAVDQILRAAMATGDYPIAFYVATSQGLVPVTEEPVSFVLDGTLDVHNVEHAHTMTVDAQVVGPEMDAIARSDLDLANHGVEFPAIFGSTAITLEAHLSAHEGVLVAATPAATEPQ